MSELYIPSDISNTFYKAIQARNQLNEDISKSAFDTAIRHWESILQVCAMKGYSELGAIAHSEIGLILGHRYRKYGDNYDLDRSMRLLNQYIHFIPDSYIEKPRICNAYGTIYRNLYEKTGQIEYLNQAIATFEQSLNNPHLHPLHMGVLHTGYANSLLMRFDIFDDIHDALQALDIQKKALAICEPQSRLWIDRSAMIASTLVRIAKREKNSALVDEGIIYTLQALELMSPSSPHWLGCHNNLASLYRLRFDLSSETNDITAAIQHYHTALQAYPMSPQNVGEVWNNISVVYRTKFETWGDISDIDNAIHALHRALSVTAAPAPLWIMYRHNLAASLIRRHEIRKHPTDIQEALEVISETLAAIPDTMAWKSDLYNLEATVYHTQYEHTKDIADLQRATAAAQAGLKMRNPANAIWSEYMSNYADILLSWFKHEQQPETLEEAIRISREDVARSLPNTHGWARSCDVLCSALFSRFETVGNANDADYHEMIDRYGGLLNYPGLPLHHRLLVCGNMGALYIIKANWSNACNVLLQGIEVADTLYLTQATTINRELWSTTAGNIYRRAAYALANLGRIAEAVVILERGRSKILGDQLQRESEEVASLEHDHPHLYEHYIAASTRLRRVANQEWVSRLYSTHEVSTHDDAREAQTLFQSILHTIRAQPGYESFLDSFSYADIIACLQPGMALVYIDTVIEFMYTIVVAHSDHALDLHYRDLRNFSVAMLKKLLVSQEEEGIEESFMRGQLEDTSMLLNPLDGILDELGENLVSPIAAYLHTQHITEVVLIPVFLLRPLPLHAARYNGTYFHDDFTISYSPSARIFAIANRPQGRHLQPLIAIGNPTGRASPALYTDWLAKEFQRIAGGGEVILHHHATLQNVLSAIGERTPQHILFGCHGVYDGDEPLNSHLVLANTRLTLTDVMANLNVTKTEMVILVSCKMGVLDFKRLSEEVLNFPIGLLYAGCKTALAPLWAVYALPTVLLLHRMYVLMIAGRSSAKALSDATHWIRTLSRAEALHAVTMLVPYETQARTAEQMLRPFRGDQPFAHPMYWAAFTHYGAVLK